MKMRLRHLLLRTRRTTERLQFSEAVTFLHGPVSTGKSTVARLVDYCFGGDLERTPAMQQEFVSVQLALDLGDNECTLERAANDTQSVRVTWSGHGGTVGSANAPLSPQVESLVEGEVYNFSDLVFYLCGVTPIKVRQRSRDPGSPLIRLSIRDIWWYCYLDQLHLDSSFFHLEDPFRGRKSQDAMRFFTGLHSERLSQLEDELMRTVDDQRIKRESVAQIRLFMNRFELGSEFDVSGELQSTESQLAGAELRRSELQLTRTAELHPTDGLRVTLRALSSDLEATRQAISDSEQSVAEQKALRAELITAKTKAQRIEQAGRVLDGVQYVRCPECGTDIAARMADAAGHCRLCGSHHAQHSMVPPLEQEALRRDLNERIDELGESIARRERELERMKRSVRQKELRKIVLDRQLQDELGRYDSTFVESIRASEREVATLTERIVSLRRLQQMPQAINGLEEEAGALQGRIDRLRSSVIEERGRLREADANIAAIAAEFKRLMIAVSFPGVSDEDEVIIDPRNWRPTVIHGGQEWSFWDAGSGGKKVLFNVCYALAIHAVGLERGLPVPDLLIIDSPTKNISEDENPELIRSLYAEIYRLAGGQGARRLQCLLIDSDLVRPGPEFHGFSERRMAGEPNAPSLIPYYAGP